MRKPWAGLRGRLLGAPFEKQGIHPDPGTDPNAIRPPVQDWERELVDSAPMRAFAAGVQSPTTTDIRASVLNELSEYWKRDLDETLHRCLNWEEYSVSEWKQADRDTPEGLLDFYQQCESWAYDLLWYDYLRTCGYGTPSVVGIGQWLSDNSRPGTHLDFGSGSGSASLMFHNLGWKSTMGDVSMPLLDFARWRAEQRGFAIDSVDLRESLPVNEFDVVTAIDTFAHVPDAFASASALHKAMRPGGYLFANFDVREISDYNAWHLYSQAFTLQWDIRRAGFRPVATLADGQIEVFRREDPNSLEQRVRTAIDALHYGPPSRIYWKTKRASWLLARRVAQRIWPPA
jgi:2-polyprenyl-3-methyl-5-hydroxy-6-metoxy-1,4-benzoquinol methylase